MNDRPRPPTPEEQASIASYIRSGVFPHIAAEAVGILRDQFDDWLKRGDAKNAGLAYREFAHAMRQAMAHARAKAEIEAFQERPLDWLRSGPGKEIADTPGWTSTVKPIPKANADDAVTLDHPVMQAFLHFFLEHLAPWPEARIAIAVAINEGKLTKRIELGIAGEPRTK